MPAPKKEKKTNEKASDFGKLFSESREEFWKKDYQEQERQIHNHYYQIHKGSEVNFGNVAFGITMVFLGFIYLAVNMGWLPATAKPDLWQLWPLLMIFVGLSMIKGKNFLSILVGTIITITVMAITTLLILGGPNSSAVPVYQPLSVDETVQRIIDMPVEVNVVTSTTSTVTSTNP